MAERFCRRKKHLASAYHPYNPLKKTLRSSTFSPSFSNIDVEILHDYEGEEKPTWVIAESLDCYAFVVERSTVHLGEVEVQIDRISYVSSSSSDGCSTSSQHVTPVLTILCERHVPANQHSLQNQLLKSSTDWHSWKFGRRFKLPTDAFLESAVAVQESGALTVTIPRKIARNPQWSPFSAPKQAYPFSYGERFTGNGSDHGSFSSRMKPNYRKIEIKWTPSATDPSCIVANPYFNNSASFPASTVSEIQDDEDYMDIS